MSLNAAVRIYGLPVSGASPENELVDLLRTAAEIEHGLMLQYLYGMYSATNPIIAGILRGIAIEEMGHFICVQNLLLSCGQAPHLGYGKWTDTQFRPFPFKLEPVSRHSLAKYTIVEQPDDRHIDPAQRADLGRISEDALLSAGQHVGPFRVGLLYAKIYWLLRPSDEELADPTMEPWSGFPVKEIAAAPEHAGRHVREGFIINASARNAVGRHWKGNHDTVIVKTIVDRPGALALVAEVSAQGEGFGVTPDGHFDRFVEAWRNASKPGDLARPSPIDPSYGPPQADPPTGDEITSPIGILFARVSDCLYEVILLATALYFLLPEAVAPQVRAKPARAAILAMRDCLKRAASAFNGTPLRAGGSTKDAVCGLSFSVAPTAIAPSLPVVLDRIRVIKDEIATFSDKILEHADATDDHRGSAEKIKRVVQDDIWPTLKSLPVS